jgi:hypothetical protein
MQNMSNNMSNNMFNMSNNMSDMQCRANTLLDVTNMQNMQNNMHNRESLFIPTFGLYPASRVSGRGPAGLGKPKLLLPTGQTQAHLWWVGH